MKVNLKSLMLIFLLLTTVFAFAQSTISGKVVDAETREGLPGVNILVKGTTNGTVTDVNGNFSLQASGKGVLTISFIGYNTSELSFSPSKNTLGTISLAPDAESLDEVVIVGSGVIDIAKDRQTPVAVSTIKTAEIIAKSGNQEFPEVMKNTPSVYVGSQAKGYGDSRINIRGFSQENLAVLFNGQPVNGMEDGRVYWSNWQGLSDIASAVQIQRGLGSSKLAISSVGATINVVTKATERRKGGQVSALFGNDNYMKYKVSYSTGMENSKWGLSFLLSHWQGDGYNDGTQGQGQTYFLSVGYKPNDKHTFNLSITGAPQWHYQNFSKKLSDYDSENNGGNGDGSISRDEAKFNNNWGYKDGELYSWRKNFYHKPVMNLNWDWKFSEKSSLSTVLYASYGSGGGTGPYGDYGIYNKKDKNGQIDFDAIVSQNKSLAPQSNGKIYGNFSDDGSRYGQSDFAIRRSSMNVHKWFGVVSNFNQQLNENFSMNLGADLRTYFGDHYQLVDDLLGLDGFRDDNVGATGFQELFPGGRVYTQEHESTPYAFWTARNSTVNDRLNYDNSERISYQGMFGQIEYSKNQVSVFFQGALSNQDYQRFDYHTYSDPDEQKSVKENKIGYNLKLGGNFNINENHNIFANTGYYSRQPFFDDLFLNFTNEFNYDVDNEKILGLEVGYGFRNSHWKIDLNAYSTRWSDRQIRQTGDYNNDGQRDDVALFRNVEQLHTGVELEARVKAISKLEIGTFLSWGDWKYSGNVKAQLWDQNQNPIGTGSQTLYLDDVKVGGSAQFTYGLMANYNILDNLSIDADYRHYNNLYAAIDPENFSSEDHNGSLELPSYGLLDMGLSYRYKAFMFRGNVNNVLNKFYISESDDNYHAKEGDTIIEGLNANNRVYFGNGTTWNLSLSYRF